MKSYQEEYHMLPKSGAVMTEARLRCLESMSQSPSASQPPTRPPGQAGLEHHVSPSGLGTPRSPQAPKLLKELHL